jgi:hypothetical protein
METRAQAYRGQHVYTVMAYDADNDIVILRDPIGDNGPNDDGLISISLSDLASSANLWNLGLQLLPS